MTETTDENAVQPENYQPEPVYIGRILAAAREKQTLSVADVARQLRLGAKQIEALEADDYVSLPGNTFVRGFIRNYARLLQLDPEPLLHAFQQRAPSEALAMSAPPRGGEFSIYPSKRWMWYAGAVVAMVVAAPLLVYFALSGGDDASPSRATNPAKPATRQSTVQLPSAVPLPQPVPTQPALPPAKAEPSASPPSAATTVQPGRVESAPATGSARIVFKFDGESWTQVRDKDGQKIFSQLNTAGTEQVVQGEPPFTLVVGNAAHVRAIYNGVQIDLAPYINIDVARLTLE